MSNVISYTDIIKISVIHCNLKKIAYDVGTLRRMLVFVFVTLNYTNVT